MPTARQLRANHQLAFMLSASPWRESSLLAEVYTRDYGRLSLIARSARKRQSDLRGVLLPFVPISLSWFGNGELKTLHRAEWVGGWPQPTGSALLNGMYVNELIMRFTAREDPQPALYDALFAVEQAICTQADAGFLRYFEWTLLQYSGFAPDIGKDDAGMEVCADGLYRIGPETGLRRVASESEPGFSDCDILLSGKTLLDFANKKLHTDARSRAEIIRLTRMLIDFRLPAELHSRKIQRQLADL